jgi:hypothetical protein
VNQAKQMLYEYSVKNELPKSHIVYYVEETKEESVFITLLKGDQLKPLGDYRIIHVHSIFPYEPKVISSYSGFGFYFIN